MLCYFFPSTVSRGTTNCGDLTPIAICLNTMSHCLNPTPSPTVWVAQIPITRAATHLVPPSKNCWNHWEVRLAQANPHTPLASLILASSPISPAPLLWG